MTSGDNPPLDSEDGEKKQLVEGRKKYDPNFKGPIKNRGCTDVICCVIFGVYMLGMIVIGVVAYVEGDPKRLLYATDSNGKVCGADIPDKPYLYFFDMTKCLTKGASDPLAFVKQGFTCPTPQVCVKECPNFYKAGIDKSIPIKDLVCKPSVNVTAQSDLFKLVQNGDCAPYYIETEEVFYRCIPKVAADALKAIDDLTLKDQDNNRINSTDVKEGQKSISILMNLQNLTMQIADELKAIWIWLLIGFVAAMIISVLYIVLARWITFPLVITTGVGVLGILGYATYYTINRYIELKESGESKEIVWNFATSIDDFRRNETTWLVVGIISAVTLLVLFLIMLFLFHRVRIACALIAEASRAVCSMLSTLFFPILPWIFQLAWFTWFLVVLSFLMSNGTKQYQVSHNDTLYNLTVGDACNHETFESKYPNSKASCLFAKYKENVHLLRMQVYHLFGWLWGWQFLVAFSECCLAGAFASYYWAFKKPKDIPSFPVFSSFGRTLSNHVGSLALGSSIIAIVKLIRIIMEYIFKKLKEAHDNPVARFFICCCRCCLWCLENCLRFLNKNAYIMIAIYGKSYCSSAKEAFSLLLRNPARAIAINGITEFILFIGKLLVTGAIGVASFFWFVQFNALQPDKLKYTIVPILICTLGAYIVATLFFSVYDMGIDTMFLSFLEDMERHDGSPEKPYFMTKSLKNIMDKRNRPPPKREEEEVAM
ncbi:choline transporter-like protein 4 isoform X2 [Clytia hemisphaerica]|uniref:Choline transporter-like protein n=1 Tax=Clytia hemisphaerica TaxID=252671 RepID=A0A7M5X7J9_9CNID